MKIRTRLTLIFAVSFIAIFSVLAALGYISSRKILAAEIRHSTMNMLAEKICHINGQMRLVESIAQSLAFSVEVMKPFSEPVVKELVYDFMQEGDDIFGSSVSFVPKSFGPSGDSVAIYYFKDKDKISFKSLLTKAYDFSNAEWFKKPLETMQPMWTEPYVDVGGGDVAMVTRSHPFELNGKPWGVATVDVSLKGLTDMVSAIKVGKTGFAFLLSRNGTFLSMRDESWELKKTIFDVAGEFGNAKEITRMGSDMIAGKTGYVSFYEPVLKKDTWVAYGPISSTGWSLGIVAPTDELFEEIGILGRNLAIIALFGIITATIVTLIVSKRITNPLVHLAESADSISKGHFNTPINVPESGDEIGSLASAFTTMKLSLSSLLDDLKREKELMSTAFTHSTEALLLVSNSGEVIRSNVMADRLFSLTAKDGFFTHVESSFTSQVPISSLTKLNESVELKISRIEQGDLAPLHLLLTSSPIADARGDVEFRLISARDITESESQEVAKRDFLSLMSHKLFTPITAIQGKLMLFKDGLLGEVNDKQKKSITDMTTQIGKLHGVIERLVNFVTIEGNEMDRSREDIELSPFLNELAQEMESWYPEKRANVSFTVDDATATMHFNKTYLRLILVQLLDNALKFNMSEPAMAKISVSHAGQKTVIEVEDNGVGIPPEYTDKIFEKFYQIDKYFTGNVEGVGLGLSYVKTIVSAFGGSISTASTIGVGTKFTVRI